MALVAREYQTRAVAQLIQRFKKHKRIVAVSPTGSGKTVIAAALIRRWPRKRVLWLAHRKELLTQAIEQLVAAGIARSDIGLLSGDESHNVGARVLVAGVGMFRSRDVSDRDLVVIDEAHHAAAGGYRQIVDALPDALVLGLTATPGRLDGKPLGDVFEELFTVAEPEELIAEGFIAQSKVFWVSPEKARALVRGLRSSGGDWSGRALERAMRKRSLTKDIVAEWKRLANGKRTIAFAVTVAHAKDLCRRFVAAHVRAEVLSWETSGPDRAAILARLASGKTKVVVTVQVLTEGVDSPAVECVVLARPTKSLTLYRQMCGRGARPSSKRYLVLDEVGNAWRHGTPERPIEWSLDAPAKPKGDMPVKLCVRRRCRFAMPITVMVCPECGANQPESEEVVAKRKAELEELQATEADRERIDKELRSLANRRGFPNAWVKKAIRELIS